MAAMTLAAISGCSLSPAGPSQEIRAARRAVERYLAALPSHDAAALRELATHSISDAAIDGVRGGTILRLGGVRRLSMGELDSLAANAGDELEAARAAWARATEDDADSLWLRARALEKRAALYRQALEAVRRSRASARQSTEAPVDSALVLRVCGARVRIRWGGPRVGPEPVDREHVARLLAVPGGPWIVFSCFPRQDDPAPESN